jgi:isoleucyl-tRNA synthetase
VQSARKKAGLNVDDRIALGLTTADAGLTKALTEHGDLIAKETLATITKVASPTYEEAATVGTAAIHISLSKA